MKTKIHDSKLKIILLSIIIIGILLRSLNNFDQVFWNDENFSLFITEPIITFEEFVYRHKTIDENPIIYFYFLRLLNNIYYSAETLKLSSIIFSSLALIISYKFFELFFNKKDTLVCVALISFNIYLIWQSKEARIASSLVFFSILNFIVFKNFLFKHNTKNNLYLFSINLFSISYYPFLITIILTQFFFVLIKYRSKLKSLFFILVSTLFFYLILNFDYILLKIFKPSHHFPLDLKFFVNFFFRSFFGSIIFGGISLIIFITSIFYLIKEKKNNLIIFNVYLIMITYIFAICYSLIKDGGVIAPRYYIFLIPSIIVVIVDFFNIKKFKKLKYIYLALTLINTLILFDNWKIQKPKLSYLFRYIDTEITKNFFIDEGDHKTHKGVNNYFFNKSLIVNQKLNYVELESINKYEKFYFICLNNAEMHYGLNKDIQNPLKCNRNFPNFVISSEKEIKDFKIILYNKDNK